MKVVVMMTSKKMTLIIAATLLSLEVPSAAFSQEGYSLQLQLTTRKASSDPDGVWDSDTLTSYQDPPVRPDIYTATLNSPSGRWLLTQTTADCNMQGMCTSLLVHFDKKGKKTVVANPQMIQGGKAVLSLNYRKITTTEIGEGGKPVTGSYDVDKLK
nr:hypothetical protein [Ochrobactrum sp. LM19]